MTAFVSSCRRLKRYCVNISTGETMNPSRINLIVPNRSDTMEPLEWLQWVLIPRMHDLLENNQPLPGAFAVAPYYEMALATDHPQRALILAELEKLDALFADDAS